MIRNICFATAVLLGSGNAFAADLPRYLYPEVPRERNEQWLRSSSGVKVFEIPGVVISSCCCAPSVVARILAEKRTFVRDGGVSNSLLITEEPYDHK